MIKIQTIHHVSLVITDLDRSRRFYIEILGLEEIARPPFDFPGVWFQVGDRQLHLIAQSKNPTFRQDKKVDSRDSHFAIRVNSYHETIEFLHSKGYRPDSEDDFKKIKESPKSTAGFPQIYILDPDRNVIELNAQGLD